jgi:hypothetical protein
MTGPDSKLPSAGSTRAEVDAFLQQLQATPAVRTDGARGRLIFALDATASREPTWDRACHIQGEMFEATAGLGGLEIQLVFYRGFGECKASRWLATAADLHRAMSQVCCVAGATQLERVLAHAAKEAKAKRVSALVFVGDAMEENADALAARAGELALLGIPVFLFHEGRDPVAERAFRMIAQMTRGAYCRFDLASADLLRELLAAVAVYAAGGRKALEAHGARHGGGALLLTRQMSGAGG